MKKNLLILLSYILVAALASAATLGILSLDTDLAPSKLDQLQKLIDDRFVEDADMTLLEDAAAAAMIAATGDRWSYYIPAAEYETHLEQAQNAYVGVGITIQQAQTPDAGFVVLSVTPGGPASEAGMLAGDLLIVVEDQDVRQMSTAQVRDLVRGREGTFVNMTVLRQGDHRTFAVERRKILTPVATHEMLDDKIGLVTIANFDERCAEEAIAAIETLLGNGAEKLIFDVRHNPGGYASEMVKLLDYLLPEGELFRMVSHEGEETTDYSDENCLEIPMAVLVNGGSYSAAEFFAAALQEYEAAVVVGEQTTGKGYYQNTFRFTDGSAAALSVGKYFTPKGVSLENVGITPDRKVEVDEETASAIYYGTLTPQDDPQIQEAVLLLKNK